MKKIVLELPDDLEERLREAGFFDDGRFQDLLREALRRNAARRLLSMTDPKPGSKVPVSDQEARLLVQEAIDAVRSER